MKHSAVSYAMTHLSILAKNRLQNSKSPNPAQHHQSPGHPGMRKRAKTLNCEVYLVYFFSNKFCISRGTIAPKDVCEPWIFNEGKIFGSFSLNLCIILTKRATSSVTKEFLDFLEMPDLHRRCYVYIFASCVSKI